MLPKFFCGQPSSYLITGRCEGKSFDELIVRDVLEEWHQLDKVGGSAYLIDIQQGVVSHPGHVRHHAERVINAAPPTQSESHQRGHAERCAIAGS